MEEKKERRIEATPETVWRGVMPNDRQNNYSVHATQPLKRGERGESE